MSPTVTYGARIGQAPWASHRAGGRAEHRGDELGVGELADLRQRVPVPLALADACSRDDGTGCWPSAATIARKANISDRTVRRGITRLEADGYLIVHHGADGPDRPTPTPSSPATALSTAPDRMSPLTACLGVTPVTAHPRHNLVRGPRTQMSHPIHQRTTREAPPGPRVVHGGLLGRPSPAAVLASSSPP